MSEIMVFEANIKKSDVSYEDGGAAVIVEPDWKTSNVDGLMFVRLQSYDEDIWDNPLYDRDESKEDRAKISHESIRSLLGKKVKVTVEILD